MHFLRPDPTCRADALFRIQMYKRELRNLQWELLFFENEDPFQVIYEEHVNELEHQKFLYERMLAQEERNLLRINAATKIQRAFRRSAYDPDMRMCRSILAKKFAASQERIAEINKSP